MACDYSNSVLRRRLGVGRSRIRYRSDFEDGRGVHEPPAPVSIRRGFGKACSNFADNVDYVVAYLGIGRLRWVGHVGVYGHCGDGSSWHQKGRGWDLTAIKIANGPRIDMNWSWRPARRRKHKRRYLAIAALARYRFRTVLTCWYDANHHDHIHFDNGRKVAALSGQSRADTVLVQAACNLLDGAGLAIDGRWGRQTTRAVRRLRNKIAPDARNIRGNLGHTRQLLTRIAFYGMSNRSA